MKFLCKYKGGSHSYGLADSESDIDTRGVFVNENIHYILGLGVSENKNLVIQNSEKDEQFWEIRHFLNLLKKTNTQLTEILFLAPSYFDVLDPKFKELVLDNRAKLLDSKSFFNSVCGYLQGEKRRANGELTGKLGFQRQEAIKKYGFSPKNVSSCLRICFAAQQFFLTGEYIVDFSDYKDKQKLLYRLKRQPNDYTVGWFNQKIHEEEQKLFDIFDKRDDSRDYKFDVEYADWVLKEFYTDYLRKITKHLICILISLK